MALTYEVIKMRMKDEGKLTRDEIFWILDKLEAIEKHLHEVEAGLEERLAKMEREKDDHIPGGI